MISKRNLLIGGGAVTVAAVVAPFSPALLPDAMNTYSHGWRMGQMATLETDGFLITSGEGRLMLGNSSSRRVVNGVEVNPWSFSMRTDDLVRYRGLQGRPVAINYRQRRISPAALTYETSYIVQSIEAVSAAMAPTGRVAASDFVQDDRHARDRRIGSRTGRLVKVTAKGSVFTTWEVSFQTGDGTNDFVDMSIRDQAVFDGAVAFLRSGLPVNIIYRQIVLRNPLSQDTSYEIVAIERASA